MKIKKILWLMPLTLIMFGCKKATSKDTNTTKDNTTSDTITQTQIFDVIFDLNGGEGSIDIQHVEKGGKVEKPNDPVRAGYTFKGWKFYGKDWDFNKHTVTGVTILTADWEIINYTMTYTSLNNGGTIFEYAKTFHYNDTVNVKALPNAGYSLEGWYVDGDFDNPISTDDEYSFKMPDKDYEISAKWIQYTLTTSKNIDGGTITEYSATPITAGTSVTLEAQTSTGYTWLGWYKGDNQISPDTTFTYKMGKEDTIIVAKWALYTLTTTKNISEAGTINPSYNNEGIAYGSNVSLTAEPNTGYVFKGWYINNEQVEANLTYSFTMDDSLTIEARFDYADIELALTKNILESGTVSGAGTYKYKDKVEITAETTNSKYKFIGWYLNDSLVDEDATTTITIPSSDVTYEARWEIKYPELEGKFIYSVDGDEVILNGVMYDYMNSKELVIPDYVTKITGGALSELRYLEKLTIPFPGDRAYDRNESEAYGMGYIFGRTNYTGSLAVEQHILGTGGNKATYYMPASLKTIIITNCEHVQYNAFRNFANVEEIIFPDNILSVDIGEFDGCDSLKYNIYGNGCYLGSEEHEYLILVQPYFSPVTNLVISEQCRCITYTDLLEAWHMCSIQNLYYEGTIEDWFNFHFYLFGAPAEVANFIYFLDPNGETTYMGKTYSLVTELVIPDTITRIDQYQFMGFKNVETIIIPDSVTFIDGNVFQGCKNLTDIVISGSLEEIWGNVFLDCSELSNVYFNGSMEDWLNIQFMHNSDASTPMKYANNFYLLDPSGDVEFRGLKYKKVTDIVIPDGTTKIGRNLSGFDVYTILIPTSVTIIDSNVLTCGSLESVYYKGTEEEWDSISIVYKPHATVYFYNESPDEPGNYWHYDDGEIVVWYFG